MRFLTKFSRLLKQFDIMAAAVLSYRRDKYRSLFFRGGSRGGAQGACAPPMEKEKKGKRGKEKREERKRKKRKESKEREKGKRE